MKQSSPLVKQVHKIIEEMPVGTVFTTNDVAKNVDYAYATIGNVATTIRKHPAIINTAKRNETAIWKKIECP